MLIGLQIGGVFLAERLAELLGEIDGQPTSPAGSLDVAMHRDDIGLRPVHGAGPDGDLGAI